MLRAPGLSERAKLDFRLQIGGDLNRYEDLVGVINRFASNDAQAAASIVPAMARAFWTEDESEAEAEDYWLSPKYWQEDASTWYGSWDEDSAYWSWEDSEWHDVSYDWDGSFDEN